ncbi:uncharacterized protein LOC115707676 isoform X1 [Cannabis sativa]|uniref:uncharacterized protein LOC115707676 isoform X1 n=2 Tax=Cannabis sativa TaxID=3483 RepID=UPI0029CA26B1|nr:uncharacterized protein LOC115707676 isoform X1 [Cannabis sativa]XP_030491564.2 uncharacterized protein LOC115707676 isoform X1 [Cannabis sativa]
MEIHQDFLKWVQFIKILCTEPSKSSSPSIGQRRWSFVFHFKRRSFCKLLFTFVKDIFELMSTSERRRSARIYELNVRRAEQENIQNKGKKTCETTIKDSSTGHRDFNLNRGKKKVKTRSIQDLIMDTATYQVGKSGNEDHHTNFAATSAGPEIVVSKKSKLELLLSILKRRDSFEIFAEPVNPNEVDGYYDTIKEPMDFGTISRKLNGGSYKSIDAFEHDVYLVSNNAMVFNASTTVYYRQARAIKNLAQKLFVALKTNPENFESEISRMRLRGGREIKEEMEISNFGSCDESNYSLTSKGCKEERPEGVQNVNNLNESVVPSIYQSPEHMITPKENIPNNIKHNGSLAQFSKDIGSYADIISGKKLRTCTSAEDLNNRFEIPNVESRYSNVVNRGYVHYAAYGEKPIEVARKRELHLEISAPHFRSNVYNESNRDISNSINNDNVIQKTDMSSSYLRENLSFQKRKFGEFVRDEVNKVIQNTSHREKLISSCIKHFHMAKAISSTPNSTPGGIKFTEAIKEGDKKSFQEAICSDSKKIPTKQLKNFMEVVIEGESKSYQSEMPHVSTTRYTSNNQEKMFSMRKEKHLEMAEAASIMPKKFLVNPCEEAFESTTKEESKQFIPGAANECKSVPMIAMHSRMLETDSETIEETPQSFRVESHVSQEHMDKQGTGSGFFSTHLLVDEDSCILNQFMSSMTNSMNIQIPGSNGQNSIPTTMNKGINVRTVSTLDSSGPMIQGTLSARGHGDQPSTHQQLFSPPKSGSNLNQSLISPSSNVNFPCGLHKPKTLCNSGKFMQAEQTLNWRQPKQVQSPLAAQSSMQMHPRPPLVDLVSQITPQQCQGQSTSACNGPIMNQIPIHASSMQMQTIHQVDLAGPTVPSEQRGHETDVVNEQATQLNLPRIFASRRQMQRHSYQVANRASPSQK